jgi:single-stranded-DNA-specific exonuclease
MPALLAPRRWLLPPLPDAAAAERLASELRLPLPLCRLLVQRGMHDPAHARAFLRPSDAALHPPSSLAGIREAVERLVLAREEGTPVLVHGDYDVDGICSTALYVRALRTMGVRAEPFVPHRLEDGYDLTAVGIRAAATAGARLILTADCGIVAHEAVEAARAAGIDVIVTDHHAPGTDLPAAAAVVNPNRHDCAYAYKGLAGVGVAWKVCCALAAETGYPVERLHAFLDLVALATIADVAPLTGENRALVRWGLRVLAETPNPGLSALLRLTGLAGRELTASQVGFVLAPRINAVGRMGEALRGVRLLLTDDPREAETIASQLEEENRNRRGVEAETVRQALSSLDAGFDADRDPAVVLAADGWHPGVIGIVASRLVERLHRPVVVVALDGDGDGKGSGRSIAAFDLVGALRACSSHLVRFGGHRMAAGCSIRPDRVEGFREAFVAHARETLGADDLVPTLRVDLELPLGDCTAELVRVLRHAGPFGAGNPTPVFVARAVRPEAVREVGTGHLKLTLAANGSRLEAIGFGMAGRAPELLGGAPVDAAFRLEENQYRGRSTLQARLVDLRPSSCASP